MNWTTNPDYNTCLPPPTGMHRSLRAARRAYSLLTIAQHLNAVPSSVVLFSLVKFTFPPLSASDGYSFYTSHTPPAMYCSPGTATKQREAGLHATICRFG